MIDLHSASRDDLIITQRERITALGAVVAEHRAVIATLEATVAQLTQRAGELLARPEAVTDGDTPPGRPQGMPGLRAAIGKARPPKQVRKRREGRFVRRRMEPTAQAIHAVAHCPICGLALVGGAVKRTREVIEAPLVPMVVTEHVHLERCCPHCRTRHTPAVNPTGEVGGRRRFGVGLVSLIATLREEAPPPVATIQWYSQTFHGHPVSVGAIIEALGQVARAGARAVDAIREEIRGSPCVHGDETGRREDGYIWTFCAPTAQYLRRGSRAGAMVGAVLGEAFAGVVSDFSAGTGTIRG